MAVRPGQRCAVKPHFIGGAGNLTIGMPSVSQFDTSLSRGISVVVPVYNSEGTLDRLADRLHAVLTERDCPFELVLVDDGSRDNSWAVIETLTHRHQWIRGLTLARNYGQHNALLCGIRAARYDVIITMDDDLQNPPEEIPRLLAKLQEGYDVVYGSPAERQQKLWRNLGSWAIRAAVRVAMGVPIASRVSPFRAIRTDVRRAFSDYRSPSVSIDVLLTWGTTRFAAITVQHDERQVGRSNYNLRRLVALAMHMLTGYSTLPLQLASWMGFGFTLLGLLSLVWVVGRYVIAGGSVPGFPFLAAIISIFSGAQLFALGVIGEYLARMHWRMMERPTYAVRRYAGDTAFQTNETEQGSAVHG